MGRSIAGFMQFVENFPRFQKKIKNTNADCFIDLSVSQVLKGQVTLKTLNYSTVTIDRQYERDQQFNNLNKIQINNLKPNTSYFKVNYD